MRVPLGLVTIPLVIIGVFGVFLSPATVVDYVEHLNFAAPLKVRLASIVPWVAGNRSLGAVAISCLVYLVLKQASDYFDKS